MDELRLDLETLEVERLDVRVIGLRGGLASLRMGYGATELGHSCDCNCTGGDGDDDHCDDGDDGGLCFSCAMWEVADTGMLQAPG